MLRATSPARTDTSEIRKRRLIQNDSRLLLQRALETLPPRLREMLVLRELEGMSYKRDFGCRGSAHRHGNVELIACTCPPSPIRARSLQRSGLMQRKRRRPALSRSETKTGLIMSRMRKTSCKKRNLWRLHVYAFEGRMRVLGR
jgi:hypothetical protein